LVEIDSNLREGERAWKAVVRKLDASRQELAVAAVQLQMTRSLAARQSRCEDGESDGRKRPDLAPGEEAHYARLLEQFEARLTEAETRRVALHGETELLRHRKQAVLRQLSAPVRSACEAAFQAGRVPAITTVASGVCSGCASRLPSAVVDAVGHGAVVICSGCARLLCPTEAR
jgi:inactivated superfamily I helicase